jgi:hypothetical protein
MECIVKVLCDVKIIGDKKFSHVKGWCGSGEVQSLGDFDGLDAPESWFLNHRLVPHATDKLTNKKKLNSLRCRTVGDGTVGDGVCCSGTL